MHFALGMNGSQFAAKGRHMEDKTHISTTTVTTKTAINTKLNMRIPDGGNRRQYKNRIDIFGRLALKTYRYASAVRYLASATMREGECSFR